MTACKRCRSRVLKLKSGNRNVEVELDGLTPGEIQDGQEVISSDGARFRFDMFNIKHMSYAVLYLPHEIRCK